MNKQVWMLGTAPTGQGGIASVLREYAAAGWFDDGAVRLLVTHHDRSRWGRVGPALSGLARLVADCFRAWRGICRRPGPVCAPPALMACLWLGQARPRA